MYALQCVCMPCSVCVCLAVCVYALQCVCMPCSVCVCPVVCVYALQCVCMPCSVCVCPAVCVYALQCVCMPCSAFDGCARLWDVRSGKCVLLLDGHLKGVLTVGFSPLGCVRRS